MTGPGAGARPMFRVKICGVTSAGDAGFAAASGADAVGVNFFAGSRRRVPPGAAAAIVRAARDGGATPVGVFVDERPEVVAAICRELGIDVVQLSGNEPAEEAGRLPFRRIKAVRLAGGFDAEALNAYPCEGFLVDAGGPGEFGGTGRTLEWAGIPGSRLRRPWILAGGLTPENVRTAIGLAHPGGVDVASGVEDSPGRKNPAKVRLFIKNALEGLNIERR
ncbi:MAG: phosphoribosylanthranilate isomerase [Gemmatimonadota bacterium]